MSTEPFPLDTGWLESCLALSAEANWNQVADDWRVFMTHGTVFGVVAEGRLVGTAAALPYGADFGWVSMVLVTPEWRGGGIATRLVAACTALLRDAGRTAFLDATPAGAAVYARLGFVPLCTMQRWEGDGGGDDVAGGPADVSMDAAAFGADRRFLLDGFLSRPGSAAFGSADGFAILRTGARAMQVGPVVGDGPALMLGAVGAATGRVFVDVLEAGAALGPALARRGFRVQRGFTRMALGRAVLPGDPARLLVAAGPEFG